VDKVPIVRWLPKYSRKWLLNDVIAGITIGVLLIPQALAYAKIATISGEFGLMSSWLPPAIYAIMGTSKGMSSYLSSKRMPLIFMIQDISPGPTSIMGLLTAEIIKDLIEEGYSAQTISGVVTFMVGVFSLIVGIFKLGFVLDFISIPVLSGFVSAAGLTIIFGQVPTLFGETNVGSGTPVLIHDFFTKLPQTKWLTFGIGFSGILLLTVMQQAGKRWGKRYRAVWVISICRNAILLIIFTGISYGLNKDLKKPLFDVSNISKTSIKPPVAPSLKLAQKVAGRCITVFIASALEHLAIAKSFGRRHGYTIDESQELCFLGISNFVNGFFFTMPTGGAFSRTAVNSESGVKSPLGGLVTSGFVIIAIYFLTGALFWIPKATLSAIIITAVWQILISPKTFYTYWRTSLPDFVASMISFWVTLFVSVEMGIAFAVGFSILHLLLRVVFARITSVTGRNVSTLYPSFNPDYQPISGSSIPRDTQIFKFKQLILFPNAYRTKTELLNTIQVYSSGRATIFSEQETTSADRLWNESGNETIKKLRAEAGVKYDPSPLRIVILDLENVTYIDTTGLQALADAKKDLILFAGEAVQLRFVGINENVRIRFEMSGWQLLDVVDEFDIVKGTTDADLVFPNMQIAMFAGRVGKMYA
jgi:sodium-independent sulfate anion transporter 11